jgi:hypothetical protein
MRLFSRLRWRDRVELFSAVAVVFAALGVAHGAVTKPHAQTPPSALIFGIYPGGGAGTVSTKAITAPEDATKRLDALRELRVPGQPFVVHIYATYSGPDSSSAGAQVGPDIAGYAQAGFEVELVLTYRPVDRNAARNVAGFRAFVSNTVRHLGSNPEFVSLQVTNEANIRNAPNAADGYYPGAEDALIEGVVAAKGEARAEGFSQLKVGMNWAYADDRSETAFWRNLGRRGGSAFRRSLDWVGLDIYPGTWGPRVAQRDVAVMTKKTMLHALAALRHRFMPLAGLGPAMPLHISENGYPTGPGRSEALQVEVMEAAIATVLADRALYHITDYRWFDLRDADSASASIEEHYGLLRDDYSPKEAFSVYHALIAAFGARPRT